MAPVAAITDAAKGFCATVALKDGIVYSSKSHIYAARTAPAISGIAAI